MLGKIFSSAFLFLVLALSSFAQTDTRKDDLALQNIGGYLVVIPNAPVRICQNGATGIPCNPMATIFADAGGSQPLPNPFNADANGNYFFYAPAGNYVIQVTTPGGTYTQNDVTLPNLPSFVTTTFNFSLVPFTATPVFNFVPNTMFKMTLTGNVTSSTLTGTPSAGAFSAFSICEDGVGARNFNFPANFFPPTGFILNTTPGACNNLEFLFDGTNWQGIGGGGNGSAPGTPIGAVQCNVGGILGSCNATDISGLFTIGEPLVVNGALTASSTATIAGKLSANGDTQFAGPNPGADPRAFGKFATFSTTTGNTTAGSPVVTLNAASNFKNNEYATIFNAGPSCGLSAPGTPAITPSVNSGGINTAAANAGASSFAYKVVAADKFGCYTSASVAGSTSTGNALGVQTFTISTFSRANNLVTANTTVAHSYVPGEMIHVKYFTTSDSTFEGFWVVNTVPTSTSFTFTQGYDTRFGATSAATGGTVLGFNTNALTWTAVTNAWKYYIYGRTGGTFTLLAQTLTNSWVDYGSPMNDNQLFPSYVPTTAPATGANDHLTAKILSGGGTTSLTLASNAGASVSAVTQSDDGPALIAAATSAAVVYIPTQGVVINSYTILPGARWFKLGGDISGNDTIENGTATNWESISASPQVASFSWSTTRQIIGSAYPQMVIKNLNTFNRFFFACTASNGCLNTVDSQDTVNVSFDFTQFSTGNGAITDYLGMNQIFKGGGFTYRYHKCLFTTGTPGPNDNANIGNSPIPSIVFIPRSSDNQGTGNFEVTSSWSVNRGSFNLQSGTNGINWVVVKDFAMQSMAIPPIQFSNISGGGLPTGIDLQDLTEADRGTAYIAAYGLGGISGINLTNISGGTGGRGALTGLPFQAIVANNVANLGQNTGYIYVGGNPAGPAISTDGVIQAASMGFPMAAPTVAPGLVVSAGGAAQIGTFPYKVQFVDPNGFFSIESPSANATTSGGNQTVTITRPTPPAGAVSWVAYSNGGRILCSPTPVATTTIVYSSTACGQTTFPQVANSISLGAAGVVTPSLSLTSNGFFSTLDFSSPLTVNRLIHIPDASGTLAFKDLSQTWTATQTFNNASQLRFFSTNGTNYAGFQGGASTLNLVWLFPSTDSSGTQCLSSNGSLQLSWSPCSGGTGTPGGANTQVQYNAAGSFGGSTCMTWIVPAFSLGCTGTSTGQAKFLGVTSGTVTVQSQDVAGTWTFKWPNSAGSAGLPMVTDGTGIASWAMLGVPGGGTGIGTLGANQLLSGNGTSAISSVAGSTTGTNPILKLQPSSASNVPLTLDTAASPVADILDVNINGVKTSWFDNLAALHTPTATFAGTGAFTLSGSENVCPAPAAGQDIICLGDATAHVGKISNNGVTPKAFVDWTNDNPQSHGVAIVGTTFPQLNFTSPGTTGLAFISQGASSDPIFSTLGIAGGGTGVVTATAHSVLLGEGTSPFSSVGPSATANLPLLNQVGADPIYAALPLNSAAVTNILPIANGGTGSSTLSGANIVQVSGVFTVGNCVKSSASTIVIDAGAPCGGGGGAPALSAITAATAPNTISNSTNQQTWNWSLVGSTVGIKHSEAVAATGTNNIIHQDTTLATSTASPWQADNNGIGWKIGSTGNFLPVSSASLAVPGTAHGLVVSEGAGSVVATPATGAAGQVLISNGSGSDPSFQDPIISQAYVNLWTAQDVTVTRTSANVRNPIFSQTGTFQITWASITGSPAGCTLQIRGVDSQGNVLNNGSALSVSPSNGTTSQTFTATSTLQTAAQISAVLACSVYPSTGTLTLDFTPILNTNVTNTVATNPPSNASTNVAQFGGGAVVTGTGAGGAGIPRVTVSNDSTVGLVAGAAIIGKVGIDQTTPGTTNAVSSTNLPTTVDTNSGNKSASTIRMVFATDQPSNTNAFKVDGSAVTQPSNITQIGGSAVVADPCQGLVGTPQVINLTASGQLIAGTSAKQTYICAMDMVTGTAQNIALVEGTGSVCATGIAGIAGGTTAATGWNFTAGGGFVKGTGANWVFKTSTLADNVCLLLSGSGQTSGSIRYVQQ